MRTAGRCDSTRRQIHGGRTSRWPLDPARRGRGALRGRARPARRRTSGSTKRASSITPTRCRRRPSTRPTSSSTSKAFRSSKTDKALTPEQRRAIEQEAERAKRGRAGAGRGRPPRPRARVLVHERSGDRPRAQPLAADDQQRHPVVAGVQRAVDQAQGRRRGEESRIAGQADRRGPRPRARKHRRRARAPGRARRPEEARKRGDHRQVRRRQAALARARRGQGKPPSRNPGHGGGTGPSSPSRGTAKK